MTTINYFFHPDMHKDMVAASINLDNDSYDDHGRNISAQQRRQKLVPWFLVDNQRVPRVDPPKIHKQPIPTSILQ